MRCVNAVKKSVSIQVVNVDRLVLHSGPKAFNGISALGINRKVKHKSRLQKLLNSSLVTIEAEPRSIESEGAANMVVLSKSTGAHNP